MEEIFTDKLIAFALRPNRIKYRDLWDIMWLRGKGILPHLEWLPKKLLDRKVKKELFLTLFEERRKNLLNTIYAEKEFQKEMERFLPVFRLFLPFRAFVHKMAKICPLKKTLKRQKNFLCLFNNYFLIFVWFFM